MKKYLALLLLVSYLGQVKADDIGLGLGLGLPDYTNRRIIPINISFDQNEIISTNREWLRLGLMRKLRNSLRQAGYNPVLSGNFQITNITILTKSQRGQGQIRLCFIDQPDRNHGVCRPISDYTLSNSNQEFNDPQEWPSIPLFTSIEGPISEYPLEIEILGNVKIKEINIDIEPIGGHPISQPPIDPNPGYIIPPFLVGKMIMQNSGSVQIGLDRTLRPTSTELIMGHRDTFFADYRWIDVKALNNDALISRVILTCLNPRGQSFSEDYSGTQDLYIHKNTAFNIEIPRACKYVEYIQVFGSSPYGLERLSNIRVMLY